jgi:hypothetical protein
MEAMRWLGTNGPAVEGVEEIRARLQAMMDDGDRRDGRHALRPRRAGAPGRGDDRAARAARPAPYYTRPAQDFSRPGRTWLPTLGRTRFPLWDLVSIWYHEGVPGHHLQLAQWAYVSRQLSTYQTSLGSVGANVEGWALYAERLMDELGYFSDPGERLGFLDAQQLRSVRVVIDIGMHLGCPSPTTPRARWPSIAGSRGRRSSHGRSWARTPAPTSPSSTANWCATSASPGRRSATSWGSGRGWTAARPARRAKGADFRPEGLAHGRAVTGLAGPRRPRRGARAAVAGERRSPGRRSPRPRPCRGPTTSC